MHATTTTTRQGGSGGGLVPAEALGRPEYSSLDNFGVALDDVVVSSASAAVEMTPPGFEVVVPPPPAAAFCRPLKTLDLFPCGRKSSTTWPDGPMPLLL